MREVLRGTIDQLSPDDDEIRTQPWFKGYQGKPTQAERIRATLGENDLAHQPAKALEVVDSAVGAIGRMTYSRASAGFHVLRGVERDEVTKIRCWVDVVLNEILPPT